MPTGFIDRGLQAFGGPFVGGEMILSKLDRIDFQIRRYLVEETFAGETAPRIARGAQIAGTQWDRLGEMPVDVMGDN